MNMRFTPEQVERLILYMPRLASEPVVATALNLPIATVRRWRMDGTGPVYEHHRERPGHLPAEQRHCIHAPEHGGRTMRILRNMLLTLSLTLCLAACGFAELEPVKSLTFALTAFLIALVVRRMETPRTRMRGVNGKEIARNAPCTTTSKSTRRMAGVQRRARSGTRHMHAPDARSAS